MASNINIGHANLCVSPLGNNQFCYIDHNDGKFRIIQAADGDTITNGEFDLDSGVTTVGSLEYAGPRDLGIAVDDLGEELPFFTLERINAFQCKIKRWELSIVSTQLKLQDTITLNSVGSNYFDCEAMAVEHYETSFQTAVSSGTGIIEIASLDSIEVGDILLLGPSRADLNGTVRSYEYVEVATISGGDVYITASGINYDYADGDPICVWKNIYLFSDVGQGNDSTRGSLYTIDPNDGAVLEVDNSGVYADVRAASWSRYNSYPAFVKESQLIYIDPIDYELKISHTLNNIKADRTSLWTVYDLVLDEEDIYRLQLGRTDADNNGNLANEGWGSSYNTVNDFTPAYTRSVDVNVRDGILLNSPSIPQTTSVTFTVKDQYGNGRGPGLQVDISEDPNGAGSFAGSNPRFTDVNGQFSVVWQAALTLPGDSDIVDVTIKARALGAQTVHTAGGYYWGEQEFELHNRHSENIYLDQINNEINSDIYFDQISNTFVTNYYFEQLGPFTIDIYSPQQLANFESDLQFDQINNDFDIDIYFEQHKQKSNDLQLSQLFVSEHESFGHQDSVIVTQFTFLYDFRPPPYSEKNSIDTDIYAKIGPREGFSLNQSTLKFKVREVSYAGDTGYVDVTSFSGTTVTTWFPFGGNIGLEITYVPDQSFHYNAVVYVSIEVYDNATTPNIILYDYWFKVTPDFRAPYVINEIPYREEEDVLVNTDISFDIIDPGVGVDINNLELYINSRFVTPVTSTISAGYHVAYNPSTDFHYGQTVEITLYAQDLSSTRNQLYDTWRFYCEGSTGPWIDRSSFYPRDCSRGVYRKVIGIMINVLGINDTGVDRDSLTMTIEGKEREVAITPIIYRID
jgi:hypothetical protein